MLRGRDIVQARCAAKLHRVAPDNKAVTRAEFDTRYGEGAERAWEVALECAHCSAKAEPPCSPCIQALVAAFHKMAGQEDQRVEDKLRVIQMGQQKSMVKVMQTCKEFI